MSKIPRDLHITWLTLLGLVSMTAPAQQIFQSPTSNGYYQYTTNNNTAVIVNYLGSDTTLTMPNTLAGLPVVAIAQDAFYQLSALTSVSIGTNITLIGTNAFFQCPALVSISIPASVTNIGTGPFIDCQALTTIAVSSANTHYTNVNQVLFNKAQTSLIEFPGGVGGSYTVLAAVTNTGAAFVGNTLTAIAVAAGNTIYSASGGVLFNKNQSQLISYPGGLGGSYTVPANVTTIVSAAFEYSTSLPSVTIGSGVTSIGLFAFYDCQSLSAISVNAANANYSTTNGVLYNKKQTQLIQYPSALGGNYTIPNTVTNIGEGAFGDAFNLASVVIPDSVKTISTEAFYSCIHLSAVLIGNGVTNIQQDAFFYCPSLTAVVIPGSVTALGFEAFAGCESLGTVCFEGKPPVDGGSVFFSDFSLSAISYLTGTTGWGATYDGIATAPCASCSVPPQLFISRAGTNAIISWLDLGYTLQSTTNLINPVWSNLTGQNLVTNPIIGPKKYFRLIQ
jgi:hypothetical protein